MVTPVGVAALIALNETYITDQRNLAAYIQLLGQKQSSDSEDGSKSKKTHMKTY